MMKGKTLSFVGMFALVLLTLNIVSATVLTISNINAPADVLENIGAFDVTFDIAYTGSAASTVVSFTDSTTNFGSIAASDTTLNQGQTKSVTSTITLPSGHASQTLTGILNASTDTGAEAVDTFSVPIVASTVVTGDSLFCDPTAINITDLEIEVDISNFGEGEDDEWFPLDRIEVEVTVVNDKEVDLDNVIIEIGLIKQDTGKDIIDDMIWISEDDEKFEVGDVDENEEETHTFEFKIDPETGIDERDYKLVVKAYPKGDEDLICIDSSSDFDEDFYQKITIEREDGDDDRAVVVDFDETALTQVFCDQDVILNVDIYNIGDEDQEQVRITLENTELGIDLEREIREDLDEGDKDEVEFTFSIPKDAAEKTYRLEFKTQYDYNKNRGTYGEGSESFDLFLKVDGGCSIEEPIITAPQVSVAKVGEDLVIDATITNPGEGASFIISATGYESWATLSSINPIIQTIGEGSAGTVTITLTPTKTGVQTFDIQVVYNGQTIEQPMQVTIEQSSGFLTGAFSGLGDVGLWLIIGIIVLVIIIVVTLIIRAVTSGPRAEDF